MDLNCGELQQEVEHKVDTLAYCNIGWCVREMEFESLTVFYAKLQY